MSMHDELLEMIREDTDGCIVWPYGKTQKGYGQVRAGGKVCKAHRVALLTTSEPPTPKHEAAHGPCHNRACVNPKHLSWQTTSENQADRRRDGTAPEGEANNSAKLTEATVAEIRAKHATGHHLQRELADEYGVSQSRISYIINRKNWSYTT